MSKRPVAPIVESTSHLNDKVRSHPAFGCITISRPHGGRNAFFGSDILHDSYISLTINTATEHYSDGWKRHHAGKHLIEVHMTADQWARMVSSIGIGSGSCCTLYHDNHVGYYPRVPDPEIGLDHKTTLSEVGKKAVEASRAMVASIQKLLDEGKISKKAAEALMDQASATARTIEGSMPFVVEQAIEHVESVVTDAKAAVEAHLSQIVWDTGLQTIQDGVSKGSLSLDTNVEKKETPNA